jgi:polyether ionophore transport system permease protein
MSTRPAAGSVASPRGSAVMLGILWHTQWRALLVWVAVLAGSMTATAAAVASLYDSPAKIHTYATAVTAGSALQAINGRVEGIDSLGGVVQDEFGFLASILLPLLGVTLVTRATRREEESGRVELLLAGRVARHQPTVAALATATAAIMATAALFAVGLAVSGIPRAGCVLYAASLAGLAFVFAGLTALLAQLAAHARTVYAGALLTLAASYVVRGAGDVTDSWVTWLSPLGWAEKAAPFGQQRWWALVIPLAVGVTLGAVAVLVARRRDLGSALVHGRTGPARASSWLLSPTGFATRLHLPAVLGWLAAGLLFTAMMGSLAQQLLDAMTGNPALAEAIGVSREAPADGFVAMSQLYLAVIAGGYTVQAVGALRTEEAAGRLEHRLSGTLSRTRWFATHALVVVAGLLVVVGASSLTLAASAAWSLGSLDRTASILGAGLAYLPAELVLTGLGLAVVGVHPRAYPLTWALYGSVTFLAFLGPGLRLPPWVLDLAPTTHIGNPPAGDVSAVALTVLTVVAVALFVIGVVGLRRRGIPQA